MNFIDDVAAPIVRLLATAVGFGEVAVIATVSTAEVILTMIHVGTVVDLGRWKEAKLKRMEAEVNKLSAEASQSQANARKTLAEAIQIENSRPVVDLESLEDAVRSLETAVSRLIQDGGSLMADSSELRSLAVGSRPSEHSLAAVVEVKAPSVQTSAVVGHATGDIGLTGAGEGRVSNVQGDTSPDDTMPD